MGLRFARTPSWTGLPRDIFNTCGRPVGQVVAGCEERRLTLLDLGLRREEGEAGGSCGNGGEQGEERDSPLIMGEGQAWTRYEIDDQSLSRSRCEFFASPGEKKENSWVPARAPAATADQVRGFDFSFELLSSFSSDSPLSPQILLRR